MKSRGLLLVACCAIVLTVAPTSIASAKTAFVVDSNRVIVGQEFTGITVDFALREIKRTWIYLPVIRDGSVSLGTELFYTTSDCIGTPYFPLNSLTLSFNSSTFISGETLNYPDQTTVQTRAFLSSQNTSGGSCNSGAGSMLSAAVLRFDLSTLGLVPPFPIELR
jgi:hypothetical protein